VSATTTTKVTDYIVSFLLSQGVERVYTLPGGFSMHLNDSIGHSALEPIYCLHEAGCGFAAIGDALYTGKLGVCVVTSGPGQTNVLTAVVSAWQDNVPLLVISGDAKTQNIGMRERYQLRQGGAQDVDIVGMTRTVTKWVTQPGTPRLVKMQLEQAVEIALTHRRGPVWISIPLDVQAEAL
jgi:acetolactate synthase-1/2/3 large subunit